MASIALVPYPEVGHLNGCLGLARALGGRGHEITLLVPRAFAAHVTAAQLAVRALDIALPEVGPVAGERWPSDLTLRVRTRRRVDAIFEAYARYDLGIELRRLGAALVVVDREMQAAALHALALGLPVTCYSTTLSVTPGDGAPPLTSSVVPGATAPRLRSWLAWRAAHARAAAVERAGRAFGLSGWRATYARWLPRFGLALPPHTAAPRPWLPLPELILCPAAFDLPVVQAGVAADPLRAHGAPFVDERRALEPIPFAFAAPRRPLVLCSLGSQGARAAGRARLFAAVIEATRGCNLVLAVGGWFDPRTLGALPEHVRVVASAPQLAILRHADLMITHGGLNSVKECIWSEVPMLVIPQGFDQPGNAARVAHHRLGLHLPAGAATVSRLRRAVDQLLADDAGRERVRALGLRFRREQAAQRGLDFLEQPLHDARALARCA